IDFGIARARNKLTNTERGVVKGKFGYMSPEQRRGETVDRRSDLFSVGILLFEMLTGRRPFGEDDLSLAQLAEGIEREPLSLRRERADIPPALETAIGRALAHDPARRYQTALELQKDLEAIAPESSAASWQLARYLGTLFEGEAQERIAARRSTRP